MTPAPDFDEFFNRATGNSPYEYQRELARATPSVLDVPTGCGKTQALIVAWLFSRIAKSRGPRRLVYALPMRTLVEQTRDVALEVRRKLRIDGDELQIHVVMGGEAPTDWREHPDRSQILIGTIDMLLSRALNRGFGENRFVWPVSFGLLNADCRWVFDEVQLMGPARPTSAQLDGLRGSLGTALPCETIWASATVDREALITIDRPDLGEVLTLPDSDRLGPLAGRLDARKRVVRADLSGATAGEETRRTADLLAEHHTPGTRSIVVLNTVGRVQALAQALEKRSWAGERPRIVLLHSRYRPPEREDRTREALGDVPPTGTIVVATQVIEAGVDISAGLLATETAPFSSLVQRLGRCNRYGELDEGTALWLDRGEYAGRNAEGEAAPYLPEDLNHCRRALIELNGESASPSELAALDVPEHREEPEILRRRDLLDLFDTSPDLSGLDVDVSRFIRDVEDRSVPVFFRDIEADQKAGAPPSRQSAARREEIVEAPIADLRKALSGDGSRRAWTFDHVEGEWIWAHAADLVPGRPLMLDADEGGYDELGWNPRSPVRVDPVPPPQVSRSRDHDGGDHGGREEAIGSDPDSVSARWLPLSDHLAAVKEEAERILDGVGDGELSAEAHGAVALAAALHDVGKAHPVFQQALHATAKEDERPEVDSVVLAKSPRRGPGYERTHFRHELASALALRGSRDEAGLPSGARSDLVQYLVASHHGRVRLSIRPAPDEKPPSDGSMPTRFALGVRDGDVLPAVETPLGSVPETTLDLACMELGDEQSWSAAMLALRDQPSLGPFRLAFLEALLRVADWRASA